jgi:hypothetical protein
MNVGTIVEATDAEGAPGALARQCRRPDRRDRARRAHPRAGRGIFRRNAFGRRHFAFAGEILRYEAIVEDEVYVSRASDDDPKVPSYDGGKFPLSTYLAARVRKIIADPSAQKSCPNRSRMARHPAMAFDAAGRAGAAGRDLPRADKHYLVCYRSRAVSRIRRSACC